MDGGAWWAAVHGVAKSRTRLSDFTFIFHFPRYAEVADALGCGGTTDAEKVEALIAKIDELKATIGIKPTIRDYVPDEQAFLDSLDKMTEQAFDDQCTGANPRYPLMSEIKQMYLNAYYGRQFTETAKPDESQLKGE